MSIPVLETARLRLRPMCDADAGFLVRLLNDPEFVRHVGDKGVRTREDACRYVRDGPAASYERHGFGLCVVERRDAGEAIGICGLLRRGGLEAPDVGFALLPRFRSKGYAFESATAALADAQSRLGLRRVLAITSPGNAASVGLLRRLGFVFDRLATVSEGEPAVQVFALEAPAQPGPRREEGGRRWEPPVPSS